jgi:hypothetical protein
MRTHPGRPKGSRSLPHDDVPVVTITPASRCPQCGSPRREKYYARRVSDIPGTIDGQPFRRIVWRRCRCLECGQVRIDKEYRA